MWSYPSKVPARINPLPHKSIPSHSFLTRLIFPSPLHLSAQIVLLINYAIIPIGWLIGASSSRFPLQINSLTTVAATGLSCDKWCRVKLGANGASVSTSFWQMKFQPRAVTLRIYDRQRHCPITTDLLTTPHLSLYWNYHFIGKSTSCFTETYLHWRVILLWMVCDFASVQLQ